MEDKEEPSSHLTQDKDALSNEDSEGNHEPERSEGTNVINVEAGELNIIESLCPKCFENGTTRLMITDIPHFKEIIVSSFECLHCGEVNNEVTFGGVFQPKKIRYELFVKNKKDMDRQVVKSEYASIVIPELRLEIPPESQKGMLNTVEGILEHTQSGLQLQQAARKNETPELYNQIEDFCQKLEVYRLGDTPFTMIVDDPSGNSYVEGRYDKNFQTRDPQLEIYESERTDIDRQLLGLSIDYNTQRTKEEEEEVDTGHLDDISCLPSQCPACNRMGDIKMHVCDIPYFKETIIMAFKCDYCGYKNNEVKSGGPISEQGLRLILRVENEADLKRDILKSETATLTIPEVELELAPGTLGGFFSTVEGTLVMVRNQLNSLPQAAFAKGDSATKESKTMLEFIKELDELINVKRTFTMIFDDPLANIYIQNPRAHLPSPENEDPQLIREKYVRSYEQDDELGLHDINTGA
ncbi:unnamed protein product [Phytomonas sp. Hart1]|nr:unnamed protein product [Phytomonas sp. Hart1]|eukprot:CCW69670.1 unnamed protein product [Phytomonas sp. isolate Hart1]